MSQAGWYPDPAGQVGYFRYWNGSEWSHEITTNPASPPPMSPGPNKPKGGAGVVVLIVVIVAILALVIAGVVGVYLVSKREAVVPDLNSSTPTISAWDEEEDTPTPTPPPADSPDPSQTPSQTSSASAQPETLIQCPFGEPLTRAQHPGDNEWIYGGKLAMRRVSGWQDGGFTLMWADDVGSQTFDYAPGWFNGATVSSIRVQEHFKNPKEAATSSASCVTRSMYYEDLTGIEPVFAKPVKVDGKSGFWVRQRARISNPTKLPGIEGDVVDVVVVDTGDPERLSMFLSSSTIGDDKTVRTMEELIEGLRVVS